MWAVALVMMSTSAEASSGVYFVPEDPINPVYNSWLVTVSVNLQPYIGHLGSLRGEVKNFKSVIDFFKGQSQKLKGKGNSQADVIDLLEQEYNDFQEEYFSLKETFDELIIVVDDSSIKPSRRKRALLPFVGSVLSDLFGTATHANLERLKYSIEGLQASQTGLIHVVRDSVILLNKTHEHVQENRQVINRLVNATDTFRSELSVIIRCLNDDTQELSIRKIIDKINEVSHIVSSAIFKTRHSLTSLIQQLNLALQGSLPMDLLKPSKMIKILK